jgi:ArsR family metal-binding transcriptional regulator
VVVRSVDSRQLKVESKAFNTRGKSQSSLLTLMATSDFKFALPDRLGDKAVSFPEASYGATIVTLVLKDGSRIPHVHVAGRCVIKATRSEDEARLITLDHTEISDVICEVKLSR